MAFLAITKKSSSTKSVAVKTELPDIAPDHIAITASAAAEIQAKAALEGKPDAYFRVGIVGGGCSGMSYHFAFDAAVRPTDSVFEEHGVKVCVDPKSLKLLGGSLLDFEDAGMRKAFRFLNKRSVKSCSCGKSFSL